MSLTPSSRRLAFTICRSLAARYTLSACSQQAVRRTAQPTVTRKFYSSAAASSDHGHYVSPMQDLFEAMENNGPTTLGTTNATMQQRDRQASKTLDCGVPESALRFTTTSYDRLLDAPFVHAKEHRVVLQVPLSALPLGAGMEMSILREIVGSRIDDQRQELRLTSDQFGSRIENKRHLVSMLDRIVTSCQRLAKELAKEGIVEDTSSAATSSA